MTKVNEPQKQTKKINKKQQDSALEQEVQQLQKQIQDLNNKLLRALADYQNLVKEFERKELQIMNIVKREVFKDLLELFTDLYISTQQLDEKSKENPYIKGILLIIEKYEKLLKKHGVTEVVYKEGDKYSLDDAEIIGVENHKEYDNVVKQTVEPGYKIGPYILRPAKIIVYKKAS